MNFPIVTQFPADGDPDFNAKAHACMDSMRAASLVADVKFGQLDAAVATATAGLAAGLWSAGTYPIGTPKFSTVNGYLYRRTVATASAVDPGTDDTGWELQTLPDWQLIVVTGTTATAIKCAEYVMANTAASELTLPASPATGDGVRVAFANGRVDNYVRRNGQLIMGVAEDMMINLPYWARRLRFVGGAIGWMVTR